MNQPNPQQVQINPAENLPGMLDGGEKLDACGVSVEVGREGEPAMSLLQILNRISSQANAQDMLDGMLDLVLHTAQAESVTYFSADRQAGECVIVGVRGDVESQHLLGLRLKSNSELLNPDADGAVVLSAGRLYNDPLSLRDLSLEDARRMQSLIVVPVRTPQRGLGVIHLFNYRVGDLTVLQLLADRLAHELDQRQQLLEAQVQNQRLYGLLEAISQMTGILDRYQLLSTVTEQASRLLDAERSTVFVVDPITREAIYNVSYQASQHEQPSEIGSHAISAQSVECKNSPFNYLTPGAISAPLLNGAVGNHVSSVQNPHLGGVMVLKKRAGTFQEEDAHLLNILAGQASSLLQVAELYESSEKLFLDAIRALVAAVDAKDPGTQGHSARVSDYSVMIAQDMGLDAAQVNDIRISSLLHDLGKIGAPEDILNKRGSLTEEERQIINRHPIIGAGILSQVEMLSNIVPGLLEHHERLDGSGYPFGLSGDHISLMARIISVADVFDAMTSSRPYREPLSIEEAISYLQSNVDKLFDRRCVEALLDILNRSISSGNFANQRKN